MPVPLIGEPTVGTTPVNPITSDPATVIKLVVIEPLEPAEATLNAGVPIADPV